MTQTINNIETFVAKLAQIKGCKFISVEYTTEPKMVGKKRETGEINPFKGQTVTKVTKANLQFNMSYQNAVNNRLNKAGETADYLAEGVRGFEWVEPNKLLKSSKTADIAVRLYCAKNCVINSEYFLNGEPMTPEQIEILKRFTNSSTCCKKQLDAGLDEIDQVKPMNIYIKNIQKFKVDGVEYLIG